MKTCSRCRVEKDGAEFGRSSKTSDGLRSQCKSCRRAEALAREGEKREYDRARYQANRAARLQQVAEYRKTLDPEQKRAYFARYYRENREPIISRAALRRAPDDRAAPAWRNSFFIAEAYDLAAMRSEMTGVRWQVDHIVPLDSPLVCGLHVETNLQVIPETLNKRKGNRVWPGMPC